SNKLCRTQRRRKSISAPPEKACPTLRLRLTAAPRGEELLSQPRASLHLPSIVPATGEVRKQLRVRRGCAAVTPARIPVAVRSASGWAALPVAFVDAAVAPAAAAVRRRSSRARSLPLRPG